VKECAVSINQPPAVVLLSGGLDSATCLAIARESGFEPYALSFRYGQRHEFELHAARRIAEAIGAADHIVLDIDLGRFGGSALTGDGDVPHHEDIDHVSEGIPSTYVPARNTVFLSFALAWAEVLGSSDIFIGVNVVDYSGYPDCRPEFVESYQRMANLATRAGVEGEQVLTIHAPLSDMSKGQIIQHGLSLGVDYGLTHTCYDPHSDGRPCRQCDACHLRARGFAEAGVPDPVLVQGESVS
jgi:7-cyano-7-deazaguanine synthase